MAQRGPRLNLILEAKLGNMRATQVVKEMMGWWGAADIWHSEMPGEVTGEGEASL